LRDKALTIGMMGESLKVIGERIKWKERVSSNGLMAESTLANTKMI